jgi:hypothetical protein
MNSRGRQSATKGARALARFSVDCLLRLDIVKTLFGLRVEAT